MPRLSVNIITKNNLEGLVTCIESLEIGLLEEGDEIVVVDTGSTDENFENIKALEDSFETPIRVIDRRDLAVDFAPLIQKWLPEYVGQLEENETYKDCTGVLSFAEARQAALEASKHDLIFWIDTDDVYEDNTGGEFRKRLNDTMNQYGQLFLDYAYAFAPDGACTTLLRRERFFWKNEVEWRGRCHETICPIPDVPQRPTTMIQDVPVRIKHVREPERGSVISDIRNYVIMRKELEDTQPNVDPRTLFYLANAARGLRRFPEAIRLYTAFDSQSGSPDDRFCAALYIASIYMLPEIQRPVNALDYFSKCTEIKPEDPRGYFGMARSYAALCRWQEAIHWYNVGKNLPPPQTLHSFDPTQIDWLPRILAAHMYKELLRPDEAVAEVSEAVRNRPEFEDSHKFYERIAGWAHAFQFTENLKFVLAHIPGGPPVQRAAAYHITKHIPRLPYDTEKIGIGKKEAPDPRKPGKLNRRIDIFTGGTLEPWGPRCRLTGIGGSEKMVLILAPQLQKLGYNVTVYGEFFAEERGVTEDGVRWEHWSSWDEKKPRDLVIFWRNTEMAKLLKNPAKRKVLWCHDVQNPGVYDEKLKAVITDFQYQSKFHVEPVKDLVPPKKVWIARNAIEPGMYNVTTGDPKKIVYLSSPDRGLATALAVVGAAQQLDPEINITIMYGFTPYYRKAIAKCPGYHRHCPDLGRDCGMDDYERYVWKLSDQVGARVIHRVGFKAVAEEMQSAGVWLYPTRFPEISCMAAMETQAAGLVPLCTRFGALAETILPEADALASPLPELVGQEYSQEWLAQAAKQLVEATQIDVSDPRREALSEAAKKAFSVRKLARIWHEHLGTKGLKGGAPSSNKPCVASGAEAAPA